MTIEPFAFLFAARNDFVTALYIIFFGVIPTMALISLGVWYTKNNPNHHWKKEAISTYVSSLDCFSARGGSSTRAFGTVASAPRALGSSKKFFESVMIVFEPRRGRSRDNSKVFTISDGLPSRDKLRITKTDLVSTTNPDAINCSSSIDYRESTLLTNNPRIGPANGSVSQTSGKSALAENPKKLASPIKREFGNRISEHIRQFQKPTKNFQGLKLKTDDLQFQQLNESPCSTSGATPSVTPEVLAAARTAGEPATSQATAPFYNKKPPPPPAPAQNLKPKL